MTWNKSTHSKRDMMACASRTDEHFEVCEEEGAGKAARRKLTRSDWLVREVLPHESFLQQWIARRFPREADLCDVVQESFERMLGVSDISAIANPKAYLCQTAAHILLCRIRRRQIVQIDYCEDMERLEFQASAPLQDRILEGRQHLQLVEQALEELPWRCREVVHLRRHERLPQRDTARRLGVSESAIEKDLRRAMLYVREALVELAEE